VNPPGSSAAALAAPTGKKFSFHCGYCSSRLEASESMCGQEGHCPTCDNQITIPILDRYGRLLDPKTRQIIKPDPHPVHAYAAAGARAPTIFRGPDGAQFIRCTHCSAASPIAANNCKNCGMPFTLEGTNIQVAGGRNGFCTASLVLGIISLPFGCSAVLPVLAIIFGIIGYRQAGRDGDQTGQRKAIAGMACGALGGLVVLYFALR
jgi:hypothetical protein